METSGLESYLADHSFLRGLTPEHITLLAGCARNVRLDAQEMVFRQGEAADQFYLVREGNVAIEMDGPRGDAITVQTVGEGEVFGWSWLFPPYKWHLNARTLETTRALAMDGNCLRGKCEEDREFGFEMMKRFSAVMMDRLQAARLQVMDIYGAVPK